MKLVDFLCGILQAHAETLKHLAGILGEDELVDALEAMDDDEPFRLDELVVSPLPAAIKEDVYTRLENTVRECGLPQVLEFYLWAYPPYRRWIEGLVRLDSILTSEDAARAVEMSVGEAARWRAQLLARSPQAEQIAQQVGSPWLRLRTRVLQSVGMRHVG